MPIGRDNWRETVLPRAKEIQAELVAAGIRVTLDERDERPGWKFAEWELRGVPLRLEIGPKDIEKSQVLIARRDTREKIGVPMEGLAGRIRELLDAVQKNLFERAVAFRDEHTQRVTTYDAFKAAMEKRPGLRHRAVVRRGRLRSADQDRHAGHDSEHADRRRGPRRALHPLRSAGASGSVVREGVLTLAVGLSGHLVRLVKFN